MARTKQTARKVTGDKAPRVKLQSLQKKKSKAALSLKKPTFKRKTMANSKWKGTYGSVMKRTAREWFAATLLCKSNVIHFIILLSRYIIKGFYSQGKPVLSEPPVITGGFQHAINSQVAPHSSALIHLHLANLEVGHAQVNMIHSLIQPYFPKGSDEERGDLFAGFVDGVTVASEVSDVLQALFTPFTQIIRVAHIFFNVCGSEVTVEDSFNGLKKAAQLLKPKSMVLFEAQHFHLATTIPYLLSLVESTIIQGFDFTESTGSKQGQEGTDGKKKCHWCQLVGNPQPLEILHIMAGESPELPSNRCWRKWEKYILGVNAVLGNLQAMLQNPQGVLGILQAVMENLHAGLGILQAMLENLQAVLGILQAILEILQAALGILQAVLGILQRRLEILQAGWGNLLVGLGKLQAVVENLQAMLGILQARLGNLWVGLGNLQAVLENLQVGLGNLQVVLENLQYWTELQRATEPPGWSILDSSVQTVIFWTAHHRTHQMYPATPSLSYYSISKTDPLCTDLPPRLFQYTDSHTQLSMWDYISMLSRHSLTGNLPPPSATPSGGHQREGQQQQEEMREPTPSLSHPPSGGSSEGGMTMMMRGDGGGNGKSCGVGTQKLKNLLYGVIVQP
ncbi:hypothetical protein EDC04DRAFT_2604527 [Pisolithus marmoratus]|nr:hypothetical protein EDC04DRAFT_2604527 [Pisolithus marmoratus]